jgi:hypothetical protein
MKLSLANDTVMLDLNGVRIYERKLEPANDRLFGLFHYKDRTEVQVRKVVLTGDWPKELTAEQLANLTAPSGAELSIAERRTQAALIGEGVFSQGASSILKQARSLPAAERYAMLLGWVLPPDDTVAFRLYGYFSPADPAPPVTESKQTGRRVHSGGEVEAPALELVAVARELGKLDELAERVRQAKATGDLDQRNQRALLALICIAQQRDAEAAEALVELQPLVAKVPQHKPDWERWPEVLAALMALERPKLLAPATALLDHLVVKQIQITDPKQMLAASIGWQMHVRNLRARAQVLALPEVQRTPFGSDPHLAHWAPASQLRSWARGYGNPPAHWTVRDGALLHYPGHANDYLYFKVPLRGDFEIECELSSFGWREAQISYGGRWVAISQELKKFDLSHFGRSLRNLMLDPPLKDIGDWYSYRLVARDGGFTVFVNGRQIYEEALPANPDPWLAIHLDASGTGGVRNLKIKGTPTIPESVELSGLPELSGWLGDYFDEPTSGDNAAWEKRGEEIYAPKANNGEPNPSIPTTKRESILQYHRPLLEDGTLEYEFYFEPGRVMVHPALDRLVLLLEGEGVKVHWLTDGVNDRTGWSPENVTVEASNRRGPAKLPLKAKEWNRLKLTLAGDLITVALNGVDVHQRQLEAGNQRVLGLFHFAEDSEVRVRNVVQRGQWAKKLPSNEELLAPAATGGGAGREK